jgi:ribonuclease-3
MEFLGDALVNLIVAEALHLRWPKADEGALTRARASLVRQSSGYHCPTTWLGELIQFGPGELKRPEAIGATDPCRFWMIVGAVHLDVD